MGYENLLMAIAADPELVSALVDLSVKINLEMAREVVARGVKIVYTGDDYAGNVGPLMSPKHFRKLFYPGLCRVMGGYKELGLYVIKHTDGNLWRIIDMIVDSGIDCLDPIDPQAGMNLAEVKAKYGHRIALKGNVDCAQLMTFGTPDQVVEATKRGPAPGCARRRLYPVVQQLNPFGCQAGKLSGDAGHLAEIRTVSAQTIVIEHPQERTNGLSRGH